MDKAAREAESIDAGGALRPRVQICTIEDLLKGKKPKLPPVYDIISAAAAARRGRSRVSEPTPEEIRRSPSFKLPITGGRKKDAQQPLPMEEPVLVPPQERRRRGGKR